MLDPSSLSSVLSYFPLTFYKLQTHTLSHAHTWTHAFVLAFALGACTTNHARSWTAHPLPLRLPSSHLRLALQPQSSIRTVCAALGPQTTTHPLCCRPRPSPATHTHHVQRAAASTFRCTWQQALSLPLPTHISSHSDTTLSSHFAVLPRRYTSYHSPRAVSPRWPPARPGVVPARRPPHCRQLASVRCQVPVGAGFVQIHSKAVKTILRGVAHVCLHSNDDVIKTQPQLNPGISGSLQ